MHACILIEVKARFWLHLGQCLLLMIAAGCECDHHRAEGDGGRGSNAQDGSNTTVLPDGRVISGTSCSAIPATVRDMDLSHPDFEHDNPGLVTGLVMDMLDDERKPVYAHGSMRQGGIDSVASFRQWYRTVDGVNIPFDITLQLTEVSPGHFVYDNDHFFPIDGKGFGMSGEDLEGKEHNFNFTTEIHIAFIYDRGQTFTFRGDDDLWLFIDGKLAIDIGGVHSAIERTIDLDTFGFSPGSRHLMDIFHAERHTHSSNFRIETTIECFMSPGLI